MKKLTLLIVCAVLMITSQSFGANKVDLTFDHYYDGPAVIDAINKINQTFPDMTELRSLGKSEEGRDIWLLTINNAKTGKDTDKPGIYVDGTIHGNEIQATEVCLYLATYLLNSYDSNEQIKELLDTRVFYIIPVINVDNRWRFFENAGGYNIGRTAMVPHDDDRDGLADEDGPEDIDGDGEILRMRIKDPYGDYREHPDDPRVMVQREPWQQGQWRLLGEEGIDNDNDGRINEDGPGYLDMNRNWGFKWQPEYVQGGAGDFPMSSKVTKAVSDFVITKPNICFDFAFHNSGGLFVRGPGSKLAGRYSPNDVKVYDFLGHEAEKIVPGYKYIIGSEDMYVTHGDFDEWMFSNLGMFGFVGELFMSSQEQYRQVQKEEDEEDDDSWFGGTRTLEKQKFNDNVNQGTMFKNWTKFNHPQLGEIEIGGWRQFTTRIPPTFMLQEMVHRNASTVIFIARHTPEVSLELIDVNPIGNGLKRIRVRAVNHTAIPTLSDNALRRKIYRPDMLTISGNNLEVISGGIVNDLHFDNVSFNEHQPEIIYTSVPSFGTREIQWIVKGSGKATVAYDAVKATNRSLMVTY